MAERLPLRSLLKTATATEAFVFSFGRTEQPAEANRGARSWAASILHYFALISGSVLPLVFRERVGAPVSRGQEYYRGLQRCLC